MQNQSIPRSLRFLVPFIGAHVFLQALYLVGSNFYTIYSDLYLKASPLSAALGIAFGLPKTFLELILAGLGCSAAIAFLRLKKSGYSALLVFFLCSFCYLAFVTLYTQAFNSHTELTHDITLPLTLVGAVGLLNVLSLIGMVIVRRYYFQLPHQLEAPRLPLVWVSTLVISVLLAAGYAGLVFGYKTFGQATIIYSEPQTYTEILRFKQPVQYSSGFSTALPGKLARIEYEINIYQEKDPANQVLHLITLTKADESFTASPDEFDTMVQAAFFGNHYTKQGLKRLGANQWQQYTGEDDIYGGQKQFLVLFTPEVIVTAGYPESGADRFESLLATLVVNPSYKAQAYVPQKATYTSVNKDWTIQYDANRYTDTQFLDSKVEGFDNFTAINLFRGVNTFGPCPDQLAITVETEPLDKAVKDRIDRGSSTSSKRIDKTLVVLNGLAGERYVQVGTNAEVSPENPTDLYSVDYFLAHNDKTYILSYFVNTSEAEAQKTCKSQIDKLEALVNGFHAL